MIVMACSGFYVKEFIKKESELPNYFEDEVLELGIQPHRVK